MSAATSGDRLGPMSTVERGTLLATILGSATVFLDGTVVNIALPAIGAELPATYISVLEGQTYVVSGYLAVLAALLVLAGALSDHYGRRRMFVIGLASFGVTSTLCGLAPTLELLALFRVAQGAAGALLVPGSLSVITAVFAGPSRARAFGIWAAATSATTAAGPLVGGVLVDALSWRIAFFINIPLLAVAFWATLRYMPESSDPDAPSHFDWLGAAVACLAVGGLALGAIRGQERGWGDPVALGALTIGLVAAIAFPFLMARRPDPLVPLSLFRRRSFAVINLSTFLLYGALYVSFTFIYLYLIGVLGYSALGAALAVLPVSILLTALSTRIGTVAGRVGARRFLAVGPVIVAAALAWYARVPSTSTPWQASLADPASLVPPLDAVVDVLPAAVAFGLGMALVVAPLTATLMSSIPVGQAGVGSAINNAISRVGQPLLAAMVFVVVTSVFYATLAVTFPALDFGNEAIRALVPPLNPPSANVPAEVAAASAQASTDAFRVAMLFCAALAAVAAVVNHAGLRAETAP
jgi:EmrB/QacA subfamily drug resistance transporter